MFEVDWYSFLSLFVVIQESLLTILWFLPRPLISGEDISFNLGKGGGGEGLPLAAAAAAKNADGERVCRRDSAMERDTACDLGDVVFGGGGGEGGVVRDEGGGERGVRTSADADL